MLRLWTLSLLVFLQACGSDLGKVLDGDDSDGGIDGKPKPGIPWHTKQADPLTLTAKIRGFESCREAEDYIEDEMVRRMKRQVDRNLKWRLESDRPRGSADSSRGAEPAVAEDASASDGSSGPEEFTTTNNQVEGVEEGDYLKNDGKYIYHLAACLLYTSDAADE